MYVPEISPPCIKERIWSSVGDNNEETEKGNKKAARKQCHLMIGIIRWAEEI